MKIGRVSTRTLFVAMLFGAWLVLSPANSGAVESNIQSSILVSEEFNDNIFLSNESKVYDYITHVTPAFLFTYKAPYWDWDINYAFDYQYYAKNSITDSNSNRLKLTNLSRIIDNVLYINVKDTYERTSLNVTRDYTKESNSVNQSDRNIFIANPYFIVRPSKTTTVTTGYAYMNTWYKDPEAIGRVDHIGFIELSQEISSRLTISAGIKHTQDNSELGGFKRDDLYLAPRYEYADDSLIAVTIGNSWFEFPNSERSRQVFWDANLIRRYSTMTVSCETGRQFTPDPTAASLIREDRYIARISKDVERTSVMFSGGIINYVSVGTADSTVDSLTYQLSSMINQAVTTKTKVLVNIDVQQLRDRLAGTTTERFLTGVRLEHQAAEKLTFAIDYRYSNVFTPENSATNYNNSRFMLELRKSF